MHWIRRIVRQVIYKNKIVWLQDFRAIPRKKKSEHCTKFCQILSTHDFLVICLRCCTVHTIYLTSLVFVFFVITSAKSVTSLIIVKAYHTIITVEIPFVHGYEWVWIRADWKESIRGYIKPGIHCINNWYLNSNHCSSDQKELKTVGKMEYWNWNNFWGFSSDFN